MTQSIKSEAHCDGVVRMVALKSGHKIWTRTSKQGTVPIMLLHGGAGLTHEIFDEWEQFLAPQGFQVIVYDQLDCYNSDKPNDPALWTIERYAEEVEEVRQGLGLDKIYLLGYSWGAVLAMEYACNYQQHLNGLVFSDFTASAKSYEKRIQYLRTTLPVEAQKIFNDLEASNEVGNQLWQDTMATYLFPRYFFKLKEWPEPLIRTMNHLNWPLCLHFNGKNDFIIDGAMKDWDRWGDLPNITVPTLVIAGDQDLLSIDDANKMAALLPHGSVRIVPGASHVPFYENQQDYFQALLGFLSVANRA